MAESEILSLSPTRIGTYRRCTLQDMFRYHCGIILKPDGNLIIGNAGHTGLDHNFTYKMEKGEDAPLDEVLDVYSQEFDKLVETADIGEEDPGYLKDAGYGLLEVHHELVSPRIQPAQVEVWMDVDFENVPIRIHQRTDLIDVEGRIIDHKFSKKKIDERSAEVDYQLSSYAYAYYVKYGEHPKEVRLDRLIRTKKPDYQPIRAYRDESDYDRMLNVLMCVATSIMDKKYYPCDDPTKCNWCGYRRLCWHKPWWKYVEEPELAQKEAQKLIAAKLAVGTIKEEVVDDI